MKVIGTVDSAKLLVEMDLYEWGHLGGEHDMYHKVHVGCKVTTDKILEERRLANKFRSMLSLLGEFAAMTPQLQDLVQEGVKKYAAQQDKEIAT